MLFNNPLFFLFLLFVLLLVLPGNQKYKKVFLLFSSYVFYGYWNWKFCFLLLWSTLIDYYCALAIAGVPEGLNSKTRRKRYLLLSIINNLFILGIFKYFNFFAQSAATLLQQLGLHPSFSTLNIILPVGISFYTFQTMAYTIDVYRGQIKPTRNFIDFANYVAFFPQLVAGPIERASNLLPQLETFKGFMKENLRPGLFLVLSGYIKKVLISDSIAPLIDHTFQNSASLDSLTLLCGLILFSFQIYFDFSGYTDIARGVAHLLGIRLIINFNQPYFSLNPADFWRRWHISLSTWFRDYLFLPLSYTFKGAPVGNIAAVMITMLLCGLWHGAAWNFVLWGFMHGLILIIYYGLFYRKKKSRSQRLITGLPGVMKAFFMFTLITITWLPFRAAHANAAWLYFRRMFTWNPPLQLDLLWLTLVILVVMLAMDLPAYIKKDHLFMLKWPLWLQNALLFCGFLTVAVVMILHLDSIRPFIYFQF